MCFKAFHLYILYDLSNTLCCSLSFFFYLSKIDVGSSDKLDWMGESSSKGLYILQPYTQGDNPAEQSMSFGVLHGFMTKICKA